MNTRIAAVICAVLISASGPCWADPYDDCILDHASAVQNRQIKDACISKTSVPIPTAVGAMIVNSEIPQNHHRSGPGTFGFAVANFTFTNTTDFRITEIVVRVIGRDDRHETHEYRESVFIERGATIEDRVRLSDTGVDLSTDGGTYGTYDDYTFWQQNTVTVTATKGIPLSAGWWPFK